MNIPNKIVQTHVFVEAVDTDTAEELLPNTRARKFLNCRVQTVGEEGVVTKIVGNLLIQTDLPAGQNTIIGAVADSESNKFYYFLWNENGYHSIFMYDNMKNQIIRVIQSKTDTDGTDILMFDQNALILMSDVVQNNLLYWVDGLNKARKINVSKALDKSNTGYGYTIFEEYINAYKKAPEYSPTLEFFTDPNRQSNTLYGLLAKFCAWFIYDDGEISNTSEFSSVALPPNQSYLGINKITYDNNGIKIGLPTGSPLVKKIELFVKINDLDWQSVALIDKAELGIKDNSQYTYNFYNDGSYTAIDQAKITRPFSRLPRAPKLQAFIKKAMVYGHAKEGFGVVIINASVDVSYQDIYLPSGTDIKLNNPFFNVIELTDGKDRWLGVGKHVNRYNVSARFSVGFDVKKGNKFELFGQNGEQDNYYYSYIADEDDTAAVVANYIKNFLRNIGRSGIDDSDGITNQMTDSNGNVYFDYTYLGQWRENKIVWTSTVNKISFVTLQDNGLSINKIKSGSTRKYAIQYEDDDQRKSLAYTSNALVVKTDFITITGELKRAVHTITIKHKPPIWAKKWQLLRTPDPTNYVDILIQQVIPIADDSDAVRYLDLVVGSLFTYQKLHPNTILAYEFERGDRVTFIKNASTGILYTPYLETEVLSYKNTTTDLKNANVVLNGSATITVDGDYSADNIGKFIVLNGNERLITGVADGGQKYVLDNQVAIGTADMPVTLASYTLIDRRGLLRIKKPDGVEITNESLVQLYKPQQNNPNENYKVFNDFNMKFDIADYGTDKRAHRGTVQDQTDVLPAIVKVTNGDCYVRNRELPTNNSVPGTQYLISSVEDPNFSDFYKSNLYSLGRQYPQYDGSGEKLFGSRLWFSNNYIEDTRINGLNDFDLADIADYNDAYGNFQLIKVRGNALYAFKELRTGRIAILQRIIRTATGESALTTSDKLLNDFIDFDFEGGIGKNPESWCSRGNFQYIASVNSGVFLRIGQDGCEPISDTYFYSKEARRILSEVGRYNTKIFGGCDANHKEIIWSVQDYKEYVYNGGFTLGAWVTSGVDLSSNVSFQVVQQPTIGNVVYNNQSKNFEVSGTGVGQSFFTYRPLYGDGSFGPVKKGCITIVEPAVVETNWVVQPGADNTFCEQGDDGNTGILSWKILMERNSADGNKPTRRIMPNIPRIDPEAIIYGGDLTITYNYPNDVPPAGGIEGDIIYNPNADELYKNNGGVWELLDNRVVNDKYVPGITNVDACPINSVDPEPDTQNANLSMDAQYNEDLNAFNVLFELDTALTQEISISYNIYYTLNGTYGTIGPHGSINITAGEFMASQQVNNDGQGSSEGTISDIVVRVQNVVPNPAGGKNVIYPS